jgi:amino acid adenylation domain-containing protein
MDEPAPGDAEATRRALREMLLAEEGIERDAPAVLPRRDPADPLVLSYGQERLWFLEQFESDTAALAIRTAVELRGQLDVEVLRPCLDAIVERHASLRTLVTTVDGDARPRVVDEGTMPFEVDDLRAWPEHDRHLGLDRILAEESKRSFDLERELPIHVRLVRLGDERHVLSVTIHHFASDGWSFGLFFTELGALYDSRIQGLGSPLEPLAIDYYDYSAWQRTVMDDDAQRGQLDYWCTKLGGELPICELPTDFARPHRHTFDGERLKLELSPELTERVRDLSARSGATMFMTLLAAFKVVLARRVGHDDIVVGTPVAGRVRPELEPLIGMFLNMLTLRTDLAGAPSFLDLLERVRDTSLQAFENQDVPFERLLMELNPVRDVSRTPLFQILFNMLSFDSGLSSFAGVELEMLDPPDIGAKFDLTVYVGQHGGSMGLMLVYNRNLYHPESIRQLGEQYVGLLEQVTKDPTQPISEYSLVTVEAEQVLPDPADPLDDAWHGSVGSALRRSAERVPDKIAVADATDAWTYRDLHVASNRLARWLTEHDIGRNDVVAIYGHRSASLVWAITGVLSAGAAYVVLDPSYPQPRLAEYLHLAKPRGWLEVAAAGPPPAGLTAELDALGVKARLSLPRRSGWEELAELAGLSGAAVDDGVDPDDLACLTFTSGSTGTPKAVLGRHGSLTHFLPWMSTEFGVTEADRFSMLSGLAHDPLQRDIFWPLWLGATIDVPDPVQMATAGWLADWLARRRITVTHLTPAMGRLIREPSESGGGPPSIGSWRVALFIGEALPRADVDALWELAPDLTVVNLYGTTETQRASGYHVVEPHRLSGHSTEPRPTEVLPLGTGMPGAQLLIRSATGAPAGFGEIGEIWMRSPHLAAGYLDQPDETTARFLVNPASGLGSDRIYRTGDRARYRYDGTVEYHGRLDQQVQLRGFRVELEEIRVALLGHGQVRDAIVVMRGERDESQLVAYVVPINGTAPPASELARFLRVRLPSHMVPSAFVPIHAVPLTANGKVDRSALPTASAEGDPWGTGARDPLEAMLVGLWETVLKRSPVGIYDNFFDLGGYSLLATRLFALVERATGRRLPVSVLFEAPTVAELASVIRDESWTQSWSSLVPIQTHGHQRPLFYVPPYTISVLQLANLGDELGPDQPLYGLQPQGLDGRLPPLETLAGIAAHYIDEMKSLQPVGPYAVAGHCSGCWVAFEVARQLEARGDDVAVVVIVDNGPPGVDRPQVKPLRYIINRTRFYLRDGRFHHALFWQLKLASGRLLVRRVGPPTARFVEEAREKHRLAMKGYEGGQVSFDIVLLRSEESISLFDKEWYLRWSDKTSGSFRHDVIGGTHATLLERPYVVDLAAKLRQALSVSDPAR